MLIFIKLPNNLSKYTTNGSSFVTNHVLKLSWKESKKQLEWLSPFLKLDNSTFNINEQSSLNLFFYFTCIEDSSSVFAAIGSLMKSKGCEFYFFPRLSYINLYRVSALSKTDLQKIVFISCLISPLIHLM